MLKTSAEGFEEVEHTADWAYRVWSKNLSGLFIQATQGLYHLARMQLGSGPSLGTEISLQGIDPESLLIAWLNEVLHLYDSANLGISQLEFLELNDHTLKAKITTLPIQQWVKDIKAATYHNLVIRSTKTGLETTIVLDV